MTCSPQHRVGARQEADDVASHVLPADGDALRGPALHLELLEPSARRRLQPHLLEALLDVGRRRVGVGRAGEPALQAVVRQELDVVEYAGLVDGGTLGERHRGKHGEDEQAAYKRLEHRTAFQ